MKSPRNVVGGQAAAKQKSIDRTVRDLIECQDLASGLAAILRLAERQKEAPSKTALRVALDGAQWAQPQLLPALVEALLPHTDPNVVFGKGKTAVMLAVERCSTLGQSAPDAAELETVRLLAPVSDGRLVESRNQSALIIAARLCVDVSLLEALLPVSDPLTRDAKGRTALYHAVEADSNLAAVKALLPHSDCNATSGDGKTALMIAGSRLCSGSAPHREMFGLLAPRTTARLRDVLALLRGTSFHFGDEDDPDRAQRLWVWTCAVDELVSHPAFPARSAKKAFKAFTRFTDALLPKALARVAADEVRALEEKARKKATGAAAPGEKTIDHEIRRLHPCNDLAAAGVAIQRLAERQRQWPSRTALRAALQNAKWSTPALLPRLIEALLPHTDLNERFRGGMTALMLAIERCCPLRATPDAADFEAVRLLAEASDGSARDGLGQTALMKAARFCVDPSVLDLLLPMSDPMARDDSGRTPLHLAAEAESNLKGIRTLLPHSDPSATTYNNRTALAIACSLARQGSVPHLAAVELLSAHTANPSKLIRSFVKTKPYDRGEPLRAWTVAFDEFLALPSIDPRRAKAQVELHGAARLPKAMSTLERAEISAALNEAKGAEPEGGPGEAVCAPKADPSSRVVRRL